MDGRSCVRVGRSQPTEGKLHSSSLTAPLARLKPAIALQRDAGLVTVTDGEMRGSAWHMDFIYQLEGVAQAQDTMHLAFRNAKRSLDYQPPAIRVGGRVALGEPIFADHFSWFTAGAATRRSTRPPTRTSVPSGTTWSRPTAQRSRPCTRLAAATCSSTTPAWRSQRPRSTRSTSGRSAATRPICTSSTSPPSTLPWPLRPDDLVVTTHLCRGNNQPMWMAEGDYEFVAEALFGELGVDGFFLEFDDKRSGGFEPLPS